MKKILFFNIIILFLLFFTFRSSFAAEINFNCEKNNISPTQTLVVSVITDKDIVKAMYYPFVPYNDVSIGTNVSYEQWIKYLVDSHGGTELSFTKKGENNYFAEIIAETNGEYGMYIEYSDGSIDAGSTHVCSVNPIEYDISYSIDNADISINCNEVAELRYVEGLAENYIKLQGYSTLETYTPLWGFDYIKKNTSYSYVKIKDMFDIGNVIENNTFKAEHNGYYTIIAHVESADAFIEKYFYITIDVGGIEQEIREYDVSFIVTKETDTVIRGYILYDGLPQNISSADISCSYSIINDYEIAIDKATNNFYCITGTKDEYDYYRKKFNAVISYDRPEENIYWCTSGGRKIDTIFYRTSLEDVTINAAINNEVDKGTLYCSYNNGHKDIYYSLVDINGSGIYSIKFEKLPEWGYYWFKLFLWDNMKPIQDVVLTQNRNYDKNYILPDSFF